MFPRLWDARILRIGLGLLKIFGLVSFGVSALDITERAQTKVEQEIVSERVSNGTSPGDLPIEFPTKRST
jgi:hypothetical protein